MEEKRRDVLDENKGERKAGRGRGGKVGIGGGNGGVTDGGVKTVIAMLAIIWAVGCHSETVRR